jgi:hypothetical protein
MLKRNLTLALLLLLTGVLVGCFGPPAEVKPKTYTGLDLVGTWNYTMRLETSITSVVNGTMVIEQENCRETNKCDVSGYLEFIIFNKAQRKALTGFSYPQDRLVRLKYQGVNVSADPIEGIVEFDLFPGNPAPAHTMVGYYVEFNNRAPGSLWTDSYILQTAGRGQLSLAGRVSAWPVEGTK